MPDAGASSQAETLRAMAGGIGSTLPCHATILRRYAAQIADNLSAAAAVLAWPEVPAALVSLAECTLADPTLVDPELPA